ncbi:MAG: AIM24 family protein, partial [Gammaproteobacteria bacterium]|nr:AIM24 family protein [Gammaproteobacteria bacterium]
ETCWAGKGGIMSHTDGVDWSLRIPGGVAGAARRMLSGEGMGLAFLEAKSSGVTATLASNQPGRIFSWNLDDGPVVTTRGSFLAAWGTVDITVTIARRTGAALFGGAGLFLQRVSGRGQALVHGAGDLDDRQLAQGESITVSTGNIAAFTDGVDYDIQYVGGARKAFFGGEGLFMTRLTGPGRVLLQSLKRNQGVSTRGRS